MNAKADGSIIISFEKDADSSILCTIIAASSQFVVSPTWAQSQFTLKEDYHTSQDEKSILLHHASRGRRQSHLGSITVQYKKDYNFLGTTTRRIPQFDAVPERLR